MEQFIANSKLPSHIKRKIINEIVKINAIIKSYRIFGESYNEMRETKHENFELIDAMFTGSNSFPFKHSKDVFTKKIFNDIKVIVQFKPQSINPDFIVSPLSTACLNLHIPIEVIEYLLKNDAVKSFGREMDIIKFMESANAGERIKQIKELFERY